MIPFDADRIRRNARAASTEDLLDRITVYRPGMEPEAIRIIEGELHLRGIGADRIERHGRERQERIVLLADGTARRCTFCIRPAIEEGWGWHKLWGRLPIFPRHIAWCEQHLPH
ncbi:MAG: hypothetical protein AB7K24_15005 [Gemmataceae bacterium]